tara:strand:+ start:6520 stop:6819 length:300 start_codon:yes stop_codon:yes gene_type:complete
MIGLATIGSTIANSRAAQIGIGVGLFVLSFLFWLAQHDRRLLQNERMRSERKARIKQDQIRKSNDEKSAQVADARASAPSGVDAAGELPDELKSIIIRD